MRGLFHSKARRTAGAVMAAVSAFLITSCASQRANTPVAAPKPPVQSKVLAARVLKAKMPALSSVWEGGHCSFKDNSVSYYSYASGETKTLKLDVKAEGSDTLLCSSAYTVLLAKDKAYVAIGGADLMDGREFLGQLGDRFTWANSYELDISEMRESGGDRRFATLVGGRLCIMADGRTWSIALLDPFAGWNSY